MKIKIVTDSICDLPAEVAQEYDISVVPVYINIDGQSFLDGIDLTRSEFYARLPGYPVSPTTSAPGPAAFVQAYEQAAADGAEAVISIHVAETMSATINAVRVARDMFTKIPVWVVDSGQLSLGIGFQAIAAARAALSGNSIDQIVESLQDLRKRTFVYAAIDTLEYLRRSGRLSRYKAKLGAMVKLKPILSFHDGILAMEMAITTSRAIHRICDLTAKLAPLQQLSFVHALGQPLVKELQRLTSHLAPETENAMVREVTPAIGAHIGPGAAGIVLVSS